MTTAPPDAATLVDLGRYPIADLTTPAAQRVVAGARAALASRGVATFPGFLRADVVERIAADALALQPRSHLEDVWGTPYLGIPEDGYPDDHPRRTSTHSLTHVIAYDLVPAECPARVLYEWDGFKDFIGAVTHRAPLHRMADPLGALNLTVMDADHVQGWHYDSTDFVVSLAVQASDAGGEFECAPMIRDADDEHYDDVARVLHGDAGDRVEVYPMTPGTLMVFMGRNSLHRVAPVRGDRSRIVALFAFDTTPHASSSDLLKLVRYGRTEPIGASAS